MKTAVPRLSRQHVPRARLVAALDEATDEQLTLVSAPAGYGKTVLLAEWAARQPELTAWVSLDDDDTDDRRFWSALLAALGSCAAVPAGSALHDLAVPGHPSRDPEFLAAVVDAIAAVPRPVRLVLDDVHELTAPDPLHGLAALVRDRPPGLRLVLSGRADPPLPLSRMRLAGRLCEIRAALLRFSVPETTAMLAAANVPARPDQVRVLVEQTEGWTAGLRLAALSLREAADPDQFLTDLVGNGRAVSDYLVGEILSRLPAGTRELLGAVSICNPLPAPLAVALSARADAGEVLDSLEQETGLVLSTGEGRTWYRVHPLLRSHLRADLQRTRPDLVAALHGRAADWFDAAGQATEALACSCRGEDPDRVARFLHRHATVLIADGEHEPVREALERLSDRVHDDPRLALVAALLATEVAELAEADAHLARADAAWPSAPAPDLVALRALARARRAIVTGAWHGTGRDDLDPADAERVAEELGLAPLAVLHRAIALLADGRRDDARAVAESVLGRMHGRHHGYLAALALTLLALIAGSTGDYRRMTALAEAADGVHTNPAWRTTVGARWSSTARAYGALLQAEPARCLELAADVPEAGDAVPEPPDQLGVLRTALCGAALFDLGRTGPGMQHLRSAHLAAVEQPVGDAVTATVAVLAHHAAVRLGHSDVARVLFHWAEDELGGAGEVLLLRAVQRAALGRHRAADEVLGPLLDGSAPSVLPWTLVEARVLECRLALRLEQRPKARRSLDHALALSATTDVLRPWTSAPPEVVDLLTRHMGSFGTAEAAVARILAARHAVDPEPVSLTDRERAVLSLLPTQRSFEEIAADLTVAHSTVKTHVRSIYGKFGVNSRRDAVASARRHGILGADV